MTKAQRREPGNEFESSWKQEWGKGKGVAGNVRSEDEINSNNTDICVAYDFFY